MMRGNALSPSVRLSLSLLLIAGLLSGCGVSLSSFSLGGSSVGTSLAEEEATGSTGDVRPTNVSVTRAEPLDVYVVMGRRIKSCWFNATDPLTAESCLSRRCQPWRRQGHHHRASARRSRARGPFDLCHRLQAAGPRDGDHHREPQDAAQPRRQDAIRHRPLAARRVRLQQENACGRICLGRSPASEANEATADALARQCAPEGAARASGSVLPCNRGTRPNRSCRQFFDARVLPTKHQRHRRWQRRHRRRRPRLRCRGRVVHRGRRGGRPDLAGSHFSHSPAQRHHRPSTTQRERSRRTMPRPRVRGRTKESIRICRSCLLHLVL